MLSDQQIELAHKRLLEDMTHYCIEESSQLIGELSYQFAKNKDPKFLRFMLSRTQSGIDSIFNKTKKVVDQYLEKDNGD